MDHKGLQILLAEASALTNKKSWTKKDEARNAYLLSAISAVKAGTTLAELDQEQLNEVEARNGFRLTKIERRSPKKQAKALFMQKLVREVTADSREIRSNEAEGSILNMIGTYSSLGAFVPTGFANQVFGAMAAHDPLFDEDCATVIYSKNASPYPLPVYDDISNVATQVGETSLSGPDTLLGNPSSVKLGAYSFCSPVHQFSMEIFQDLDQAGNAFDLFARFAGDRMARGIGAKLVNGTGGSTTINGLLTALAAAGTDYVTAAGSSANTGGAETGANSIGSADLANLYFSVNSAYRASDKCAWLMADSTLKYLCTVVTKYGEPLVDVRTGAPTILGKPVRISPSMPAIGSNAITVAFGDFSYWYTRIVVDDLTRIQVVKEVPGLIENGLVGLRYFMRADGNLCFDSPNGANAPINYIVQHS
jgi:HK97 family phage major capsid protein